MHNNLFKQLASLLNAESEYPNYMDWELLMPIAVEHGVSLVIDHVLGHQEAYFNLTVDGDRTEYQDHREFNKTPQLAIVKCLIAKLENEN